MLACRRFGRGPSKAKETPRKPESLNFWKSTLGLARFLRLFQQIHQASLDLVSTACSTSRPCLPPSSSFYFETMAKIDTGGKFSNRAVELGYQKIATPNKARQFGEYVFAFAYLCVYLRRYLVSYSLSFKGFCKMPHRPKSLTGSFSSTSSKTLAS